MIEILIAIELADSQTRTKLIAGLEDRLNRIESFVMSDLVPESIDLKVEDRRSSTQNISELDGGMTTSTRSYPTRPAASPVHARRGSSRLASDGATPHSETSAVSTSSLGEKSMDFIATDEKGQAQYIGK
jgi:hypothetical protein